MSHLSYFQKWIPQKNLQSDRQKICWSYTRVSSKEQASNYSLDTQRKAAQKFSQERKIPIVKEFGYTYESAKNDISRKEFNNMINECMKAKVKPDYILIYVISRFSRNVKAIDITENLISKGIHLIEVTTGLCTENEDDRITIYRKLLEARKENIDRLKFTMPNMKAFLEQGNWFGNVPKGYTLYGERAKGRYSPEQRIEINAEGKLIQQAWRWKLMGYKDVRIRQKLASMGLKMTKQHLSRIWRSPFYCGISTNKMLDNPVAGKWNKMVSINDFQLIQKILEGNHSGYMQEKGNPDRPLSSFLKCKKCGKGVVGYSVKKKNKKGAVKYIHYYRCNYCNGESYNANKTVKSKQAGVHELFEQLLSQFYLDKGDLTLLEKQLKKIIKVRDDIGKDDETKIQAEMENLVVITESRLIAVMKKLDVLFYRSRGL